MGKVRYKEISPKFKTIAPDEQSLVFNQSMVRDNSVSEIFQIDIENILPYSKQARKIFNEEEIDNLAKSIKEVGIISPLLVVKSETQGNFYVVNGERRLRAAKQIGLKKVPCVITDKNDKTELISIIDNIQRTDLHPVELAEAYQSLIVNYGDKKNISEQLGVGYTSFLEILKLNDLPTEIKRYLLDNNVKSRAIFRTLLKLDDIEKMKKFLGISKEELTKTTKKILLRIDSINEEFSVYIKKNMKSEQINEILKILEKAILDFRGTNPLK